MSQGRRLLRVGTVRRFALGAKLDLLPVGREGNVGRRHVGPGLETDAESKPAGATDTQACYVLVLFFGDVPVPDSLSVPVEIWTGNLHVDATTVTPDRQQFVFHLRHALSIASHRTQFGGVDGPAPMALLPRPNLASAGLEQLGHQPAVPSVPDENVIHDPRRILAARLLERTTHDPPPTALGLLNKHMRSALFAEEPPSHWRGVVRDAPVQEVLRRLGSRPGQFWRRQKQRSGHVATVRAVAHRRIQRETRALRQRVRDCAAKTPRDHGGRSWNRAHVE